MMRNWNDRVLSGALLATAFVTAYAFGALNASASERGGEYELSGTIVDLDSKRMVVQSAESTLEFGRSDSQLKLPRDAKIGDRVSIWYTLDVTRVRVSSEKDEQSGQVAPDSLPSDSEIIRDDRIFFGS
jgi:hypothetical protein